MGEEVCRTVVVDTNVIINFLRVDRLDLLGQIPGYIFVVPEDVVAEVSYPDQVKLLAAALARGDVRQDAVRGEERSVYADLCQSVGIGEAACLAIAEARGWLVATDELRRVRRWIQEHLDEGHTFTTPGLLVLAIRCGLLTIEEADTIKAILEEHNFRMKFRSFKEILSNARTAS